MNNYTKLFLATQSVFYILLEYWELNTFIESQLSITLSNSKSTSSLYTVIRLSVRKTSLVSLGTSAKRQIGK